MLLVCSMVSAYSYGQETGNITFPDSSGNGNKAASCGSGCCCGRNGQAPLGVMTDHIHEKGTWMLSYTYMDMHMQGNRIGSANASDNTIYQHYMMAPENMTMQMHMAMLMYGVTDGLTLMAMGGFAIYNMSMNMSMPGMVMTPGNMTMRSMSSGITDTRLYGLFNCSGKDDHRTILSLGVNMPTGPVTATGTTMFGADQRVSYDMQPGTGSYSLLPGITYVREQGLFSYGADAGADIKLDNNSLGYRFGNVYHASVWAGYRFLPFVSGSLRAEGVRADKLMGSDPVVSISAYENIDPTTDPKNYGGTTMSLYAGLNFHTMKPALAKFNLLVEYGVPVYQDLNGTQMSLKSNLLAGLQYSF